MGFCSMKRILIKRQRFYRQTLRFFVHFLYTKQVVLGGFNFQNPASQPRNVALNTRTLSGWVLLFYTVFSIAQTADFTPEIDKIINQVDPAINMGMIVVDLNTGATLYKKNPTRLFIPASNMKLFSDAAALLALGPDYRFKSQLTTDAALLENGLLKGSLYLYLPGDPSFTQEDLKNLLSKLPSLGIKRIQGNMVLVGANQTVDAYAPGRMKSDRKYSYGAPVAPVVIDENRITVTVNPGYRAGEPALVEFNNPCLNKHFSINNQIKTEANSTTCSLDFSMDEENQLTIRGCIGVGQWAIQQRVPVINPLRYAQDLIKVQLSHLGIALEGQILLGKAPPVSSLLISSHVSVPLTQIIADTLKPSDNLYADSLYLHAAKKLNGSSVNWQQAQPIIKDFLQQQTGIHLEDAVLADGSGLSRQDQLTAQQTVSLLRFLFTHFPLAYEYIAALPIAGQDGTLQRRFRKPNEQGLLRAKTGTMTGVMSLSGYLYTANAHTLAFAIYINKTPESSPAVSGQYRSLVDTLCDFFLQLKPDNQPIANDEGPLVRVAFQQQVTQADAQRSAYAKWRQLESAVKRSLQGQAITILFRGNQLVLQDNGADINKVWSTLQTLRKKFVFTVALQSNLALPNTANEPLLLWVKTNQKKRIWTLHEAV